MPFPFCASCGIFRGAWTHPNLPRPRRPSPRAAGFSRRTLFKLAGGAAAVGLGAEILRVVAFTNVHTVVPGRVYRTAQLTPERLQAFIAEKGIRTVVNLRGVCSKMAWYLAECRTTHAANVNQEDITFSAKRFPAPAEMRRLVEVLDHTAYPIVFHCQRGADRTGMASTVARLLLTDDDLPTARRQMWPRYGHFAVGRTAVLDAFFDYYEEWLKARGEVARTGPLPEVGRDRLLPRSVPRDAVGGRPAGVRRRTAGSWSPCGRRTRPSSRGTSRPAPAGGIRLRYTLTDLAGGPIIAGSAGHLARTVHPGEHIDLACGLPPLPRGAYSAPRGPAWTRSRSNCSTPTSSQYGSEPLMAPVSSRRGADVPLAPRTPRWIAGRCSEAARPGV